MTEKELIENHQRYLERVALYRQYGYDIDKERSFIIEKARSIEGSILEVGTGKGYFTMALARAGFNFFSFDISVTEQKYALLNLMYHGWEQQVSFGVADVECLPCEDGFFDVIFAVNMVHHLSSVRKFCDELIRILKPAGKMILSDFNTQGFAIVDKIHALEGRQHEMSAGTLAETKAILKEYGMKVEEHHDTYQHVLVASRILM
jgi:2-polyprenyl-3-methyl-5-hydroxy-6-metoxy-1,4-benzoquinol methylase